MSRVFAPSLPGVLGRRASEHIIVSNALKLFTVQSTEQYLQVDIYNNKTTRPNNNTTGIQTVYSVRPIVVS